MYSLLTVELKMQSAQVFFLKILLRTESISAEIKRAAVTSV